MISILSPTTENIRKAAQALRHGDLVAMPTETVYGLAGDALNPAALARIFEVKQRPFFDPLIVHIADRSWVDKLCKQLPNQARVLMDHFWPGPLTLALPRSKVVPDLATSGLPTVALRMPSHPVALSLIREAGTPLAAPSANPFGKLSPTRPEHVAGAFEGGIDCVLDGGACSVGVESTIIGWENAIVGASPRGRPVLLRSGGIPVEELEKILGEKISTSAAAAGVPTRGAPTAAGVPITVENPMAPGQLASHYSPRTLLRLLEPGGFPRTALRHGLLWFGPDPMPTGFGAVENISASGNLREAAMNLFAALHKLDSMGLDGIYACAVPETGLGLAVNDRLRRGCARFQQ